MLSTKLAQHVTMPLFLIPKQPKPFNKTSQKFARKWKIHDLIRVPCGSYLQNTLQKGEMENNWVFCDECHSRKRLKLY